MTDKTEDRPTALTMPEVTPEMIEAGVMVLSESDTRYEDLGEIVADVFAAMAGAVATRGLSDGNLPGGRD